MEQAVAKKAALVEIIPGKGSGQLKKRVLRFLDRKEVKGFWYYCDYLAVPASVTVAASVGYLYTKRLKAAPVSWLPSPAPRP